MNPEDKLSIGIQVAQKLFENLQGQLIVAVLLGLFWIAWSSWPKRP